MRINVKTHVKTKHSLTDVFHLFNKEMFYFLTKGAPVKPIRYDGDEIGSEIHLQLTFPWKQEWVSVIKDRKEGKDKCFFIDEGKKLPFNLKTWDHEHAIHLVEDGVIIEDAIEFSSTNWFSDGFWWLSFLPQFLLRKRQYRQYITMQLG